MKVLPLSLLIVFLCNRGSLAVKLPGPLVYVVTPSSNPRVDEGRSAPQPFYYHNWMRRMDSPSNLTTTTTKATPVKTPDLIFAEFESDKMKNIRKLLEKEKVENKSPTSTTSKPIYVSDEDINHSQSVKYDSPMPQKETMDSNKKDMTDYFALYNNLYNIDNAPPAPVYLPSTTTTPRTTTSTTTTTTTAPINNVENIWNIIDSEKHDQYLGQWHEVSLDEDKNKKQGINEEKPTAADDDDGKIDENFALPGLGTNPNIGGENESRAIRTEPNIRFPYVNLKPFQMKNNKKPFTMHSNSKKGNNMYTNLDDFIEVKHPVRGEIQDVVPNRQPIDRYNPAQPYLPGPSEYGSKSKQSSPSGAPTKTVSNLVPPPPPKISDDDFPVPSTYEQFPPFVPSDSDTAPISPPSKPSMPPASMESEEDSNPTMDLGYRYKPPSPPSPPVMPSMPKPYGGYSYDKPAITVEAPPSDDDKPEFQGYHYSKPAPVPDQPVFYGYEYKKPEVPELPKDVVPSYGSDFPPNIFDSYQSPPTKGEDDMKGDDMDMVPPPISDSKPGMDDNGFPDDIPSDFKYGTEYGKEHDFHHDHHFYHYPKWTTTTTTTTTEMPRVNRYSYYYLGKKLYYLPLYFSVYFIVYVAALIIKAVLRHKIVYPNSWRPNDQTASFFSKRSVDSYLSNENLHELTGRVTHAIASATKRYMESKKEE